MNDNQGDANYDVLDIENLNENVYQGTHLWKPGDTRGVYGGQLIAQSLAAANCTTKDINQLLHSMHCYFIYPGNPHLPVIYTVHQTSHDSHFTKCSVHATQEGKIILTLQVSYYNECRENVTTIQKALSFQSVMPTVCHHSELTNIRKLFSQTEHLSSRRMTENRLKFLKHSYEVMPFDFKPIDPAVWFRKVAAKEPKRYSWVRAQRSIGKDQNLNRCMAAYISDWSLIWTAYVQYPEFKYSMSPSLDHSMWFHHPFQMSEWMLYEYEAVKAESCRALVFGRFYREDGVLAITVAQQGLLRPYVPDSKL